MHSKNKKPIKKLLVLKWTNLILSNFLYYGLILVSYIKRCILPSFHNVAPPFTTLLSLFHKILPCKQHFHSPLSQHFPLFHNIYTPISQHCPLFHKVLPHFADHRNRIDSKSSFGWRLCFLSDVVFTCKYLGISNGLQLCSVNSGKSNIAFLCGNFY